MTKTYSHQSSTTRIRSAQEVNLTDQPNVATLVSKVDGARPGQTSSHSITLISLPENGPVAAQAFASFLTRLLPGISLNVLSKREDISKDRQPVLVLISDPVFSLAWRIQEGASPGHAFSEWKDSATALLALHRSDRRRILLVDPAILAPSMSPARNVLAIRLEKMLVLPPANPPVGPAAEEAGEHSYIRMLDPEAFVFAISLLADQSVADLLQELRAVTIGNIEARDTRGLVLSAWSNANRIRARTSLLCEHLELQTTRSTLDTQRSEDKVTLLDKEFKAQVKATESSERSWGAERQTFARQLAERDHQIAVAQKAEVVARTKLKHAEDKIVLLDNKLEAQVKATENSERLWAAERQALARQIAERDQQVSVARKEQADTKTKLQHVQDKVKLLGENLLLQGTRRQEVFDRFAALEERFVQLQKANSAEKAFAKREFEKLLNQKIDIERRRAHAHGRIEALLASSSWRVTRPLRAVKKFIPRRA